MNICLRFKEMNALIEDYSHYKAVWLLGLVLDLEVDIKTTLGMEVFWVKGPVSHMASADNNFDDQIIS